MDGRGTLTLASPGWLLPALLLCFRFTLTAQSRRSLFPRFPRGCWLIQTKIPTDRSTHHSQYYHRGDNSNFQALLLHLGIFQLFICIEV